jgi:hypothetical protein
MNRLAMDAGNLLLKPQEIGLNGHVTQVGRDANVTQLGAQRFGFLHRIL